MFFLAEESAIFPGNANTAVANIASFQTFLNGTVLRTDLPEIDTVLKSGSFR